MGNWNTFSDGHREEIMNINLDATIQDDYYYYLLRTLLLDLVPKLYDGLVATNDKPPVLWK